MTKLVFIHSLNNYSGSPKVLSIIIRNLADQGYPVELITSNGDGFLSGIPDIDCTDNWYRWHRYKLITFFLFLISQIRIFYIVLFHSRRNTVFYLNTVATSGAALACRLTKKKFVYHIHENMSQCKPLYGIHRTVFRFCNRRTIFVSAYLQSTAVGLRDYKVVYNGLDCRFIDTARQYLARPHQLHCKILMVASLRRFKGVYEFVELAKRLPQYPFELVVSSSPSEVLLFCKEVKAPSNLVVFPLQTNLHPFYQQAKVLLQLSHPDTCVETFGLTILEAMTYGIPTIVPNAGGPLELVDDGQTGYVVNPLNLNDVVDKIELLMNHDDIYTRISEAALLKSASFSETKMVDDITTYVMDC